MLTALLAQVDSNSFTKSMNGYMGGDIVAAENVALIVLPNRVAKMALRRESC
jgi:hypothetical protein